MDTLGQPKCVTVSTRFAYVIIRLFNGSIYGLTSTVWYVLVQVHSVYSILTNLTYGHIDGLASNVFEHSIKEHLKYI